MDEQLSLELLGGIEAIPIPKDNTIRNWENAFQNWSNRMALDDNYTGSLGVCGWGAICDYCEDNSCRAKGKRIDYTERDFEKVWRGEV